MTLIEKATGKPIIRIETNDLDEMEEVRSRVLSPSSNNPFFVEHEEGFEVIRLPQTTCILVRSRPERATIFFSRTPELGL